jgi:hypothetical protein
MREWTVCLCRGFLRTNLRGQAVSARLLGPWSLRAGCVHMRPRLGWRSVRDGRRCLRVRSALPQRCSLRVGHLLLLRRIHRRGLRQAHRAGCSAALGRCGRCSAWHTWRHPRSSTAAAAAAGIASGCARRSARSSGRRRGAGPGTTGAGATGVGGVDRCSFRAGGGSVQPAMWAERAVLARHMLHGCFGGRTACIEPGRRGLDA